jgi:hypothetical protein
MNLTANISGTSDRTLLFVHGRDFKPAADELLDLCITAVKAGIKRDCPDTIGKFHAVEKRLAYYGDLSNEYLESLGRRYDAPLDSGDRRNALQTLSAIDKRKNFGVHRYDRVPGKTALAEFAADVIGPVLGKIGLSTALISKVCVDLGEYWNDKSDFGSKVRERVRSALVDALQSDNHIMLITHGTGCVIAYDALWELSHTQEYSAAFNDRKIDAWITLGAPLGDSMIRGRLMGAKSKGLNKYPTNIVSWYNVSAEDDYLCHDNTLADDFKGMLKQKQVSLIKDYRIYNLAVRYGKSNPHSSIGYLIHPRVAQLVADWLNQGPAVAIPTSTLL